MAKIAKLVALFLALVAGANVIASIVTKTTAALWEALALLVASGVVALLCNSWERYHRSGR